MNSVKVLKFATSILIVTSFSACAGSSYKTLYPEASKFSALPVDAEVFITKETNLADCKYTKIGELKVASKTWGGAGRTNKVMRKLAREKGGNAVIGYNFWVAPNGFVPAAPQCDGTVINGDLDCIKKHTASVD